MEELEARVRCLELAAQLHKPSGDYAPEGIVKTATILYAFAQASPQAQKPVEIADKPKRGRPVKETDILS